MNATGTRPVPCNLDSWPGVSDLVNDYKHILHILWSSSSNVVSVIGVGSPGVFERVTGATRLDEPVVLEALRELERRSLIALDELTRELVIRRWLRFHKIQGKWAVAAELAYRHVMSTKLRSVLIQQEGLKDLFPIKTTHPRAKVNVNRQTAASCEF